MRLLTSVLVVPCCGAVVMANQVATLDVVSGGQLILGVGTRWNSAKFAAVGCRRGNGVRGRTTTWGGSGVDAAEAVGVRRRLGELAEDAERFAVAAAMFLTPPGRPLGGAGVSAGSAAQESGELAEARG
ncbi:hypothetical protein TR51_07625 [Kitasatospora griseola]|uniref:Luciferase-like domain-containing protein n=1 Tax=Kitasatospora griseola TaxID=2064 RepID=A0A0D0Q3V7_KITGR|nr:hypothetical protein TR51_07625 [Kitasatospora griseola]